MASGTWTHEVESPVEASRLFKAALLDWHTLGPKLVPEFMISAVLEGDGGPGSTRQLNFSSAMAFSYVKERLDFVDKDKFESKQTLIGGGDLGTKLESASTHFRVETKAGGGCICKVVATYKLLAGVDQDVKGETEQAKEMVTAIVKAAEAYLLANPEAYA